MANKKSSTTKKRQPGKVLFSISWGGVVAVSLFMIIAMAWAFILGVMLGRGYQPEAIVPQIANVMPPSNPVVSEPEKQPILKPEELGFFERLKDDPSRSEAKSMEKAARPVVRTESPRKPKPAPAAKPKPKMKPKPVSAPTRSVLFQIGAVQDKSGAKREQARMAALGLQTGITPVTIRGAQWYRILVRASGTAEDIAAVKRKLAKAGVKNPIIRKN